MLLTANCGVNLYRVMESRIRALYKIDAQPDGPARARGIIAEELSAVLSASELDDMKLMVSELVTNGIVHLHHENGVPVMVDLCFNGNIGCAVLDHGKLFAPTGTGDIGASPPGLSQVVVTGVGNWRGEGLALLERVR